MPPVPFDTHAVVQQLAQAGFPAPQAEGLMLVLTQVVASAASAAATPADLTALRTDVRSDLTAVRTELQADLAAVRTDLRADLTAVRTDLKADIAAVRAEIQETRLGLEVKIEALKSDLHKSFLGMMTPIYVGLLFMLIRAFWPHTP